MHNKITAGLLLWASAAAAQAGTATDTLHEVVISATRKNQDRFITPFSVETLHDPGATMRQDRTIPEALGSVPGVFIQKTNHGGGAPFLRGLTGNQTLIMVDGIRFNNATFRYGPNQYANLVDLFFISNIEIVKGSGSVQYGSDAMGGVIHLLTKNTAFTQQPGWFGAATGRVISQGMEHTLRAEAGYTTNTSVLEGGYTFRNFGDLYGGDTTGKQTPSGYKERNWNVKFKMRLHNKIYFTASSQQVVQKEVPLYHRVKLENFDYYQFNPQKSNLSYARFNFYFQHTAIKELEVTGIYKRNKELRAYHKNGNSNYYQEQDDVTTTGVTLNAAAAFTDHWSANSGLEFYHDRVGSTRKKMNNNQAFDERGLYPDNAVQHNLSVYSLHHAAFTKWQLEGGLRYNLFINSIPADITLLPGQRKEKDVLVKPFSLVGNTSVLYRLHKQKALYFSFSTGYRAPNIDDMGTLGLVDFRYELPAYHLRPEKSYHAEIGYRYHHPSLQLDISAYYMRLRDLISRISTGDSILGYPVYIKVNDQQAYISGLEVNGSWELHKHWQIKSFAVYQYGQNVTRQEPLRRIPPANGQTSVLYHRKHWYISAAHQWATKQTRLAKGDKDDNRIPKDGTPGWQLVHMYVGYERKHCHLKLSGSNLLNADYRTHGSGINGMGSAITFSITLIK